MKFALPSILLASAAGVFAGPVSYALCQTGCNGMAVACYAAAGCVFGTVATPAAPAAIIGCNAALGKCSATCATIALFAPTA